MNVNDSKLNLNAKNWLLVLCIAISLLQTVSTAQAPADGRIDSMDEVSFNAPKEKGKVEQVPGKVGGALHFSFDDNCIGVYMVGRRGGTPEWDKAAGFSFWVKGDGSDHLGGLEFIYDNDYGTRYACSFPIDGTDWKKIVVPWRDLIPEMGKTVEGIDPKAGHAPSKLGPFQFGKWWYWRDYAAHSYAIDEIRLEPTIPLEKADYRPTGNPLARVLAKLKAGKPITLVTMGDSLTDVNHWTNREHNWPALLKAQIKQKYNAEVTIVNPAMGGTELRQNVILLPHWTSKTPQPDLVTIFFGFNDYSNGMRGPVFAAAQQDAVDRVRRATGGHADVLILTSCPTLENGDLLKEMASGCQMAAKAKNAGVCDIFSAFNAVPATGRAALYATDKVHLSLNGQELVATSVLNTLEKGK